MDLAAVREDIAVMDALLSDIAERPVDLSDQNWLAKLSSRVPPVEEAGVATEAAAALAALLDAYEHGDEPTRSEVRRIFRTHTSFSWAVGLPREWHSPAEFRRRLILISARDQVADPRDELVELWALCDRAREHGIDLEPVVREVASISADVDHYGMGSTRSLIMRGPERH
ncbi:MAG TPA: hypothetical protein VFM55_17445 [Micromonosporaceae bacterium]|nr:hypothetical protein [Micromonosporaceae bacterium]